MRPVALLLFGIHLAFAQQILDVSTEEDLTHSVKEEIGFFSEKVAAACVLPLIILFAAIIGGIVCIRSSQGKRLLKGYFRGSTTDTDSVSDQQMQKYASSHSMDKPVMF